MYACSFLIQKSSVFVREEEIGLIGNGIVLLNLFNESCKLHKTRLSSQKNGNML